MSIHGIAPPLAVELLFHNLPRAGARYWPLHPLAEDSLRVCPRTPTSHEAGVRDAGCARPRARSRAASHHVRRDARAWAQPKWICLTSRSSSGPGLRVFIPATRVRLPHAAPPNSKPEGVVELTLRRRKPAATIGRHRNPSPENIRFVNSVARVPACLAGSRGFDSRTRRQKHGCVAERPIAAACKAASRKDTVVRIHPHPPTIPR